ncbi:MAG: hypothetical protein JO127_04425 [Caulobacteraceae bacterium]|nr:hypothetical protein [Caulobacteraceae bacterium]
MNRSTKKTHGARVDGGSLFVEAVIAAAIVALALAATFRAIAESADRGRRIETHREAALVAQSELASVGSDIPLQEGGTSGVAGDLVWRLEVSPYSDGVDASAVGALWRVTVAVRPRTGAADIVRLETLRLGPRP